MAFVNQFNSKSDHLMDKLRTKADGKTVITLWDEFNRVSLDAIAQVFDMLKHLFFLNIFNCINIDCIWFKHKYS